MSGKWLDDATLVLVGSIGSDASCWDLVGVPDDAIRIEYPGHGSRERQPGWTHESLSDEIVARVDGPIDVVGVALGGTIVANLLQRHPGRIRSAMTISAAPVIDPDPSDRDKRVATSRARAAMPSDSGMSAVLEDTLARWFTPWAVRTDQPGVRYARERLLALDPGAWYDIWMAGALSEPISGTALAGYAGPLTIIGGVSDFASGIARPAQLHELVRRSRYEVMPISHMAHLENPESVRAALDRHRAWLPIGQRVEPVLGSAVWLPADVLVSERIVTR